VHQVDADEDRDQHAEERDRGQAHVAVDAVVLADLHLCEQDQLAIISAAKSSRL
jgi:hypothetical protein